MTFATAGSPPITQSVGCFQSVVNFHNDIVNKLKESCSCISKIEINNTDTDGTIMKVIKMFAMIVAIIPFGLWHLLCLAADKVTSCCRSTLAQQNTLPNGAASTASAAGQVLNSTGFVPADFLNVIDKPVAQANIAAAADAAQLAIVGKMRGMSPVAADQQAVLAAIQAWVAPPFVPGDFFSAIEDKAAAKAAVVAAAADAKLAVVAKLPGMSPVVADQQAVLAAIQTWVAPPFVAADFLARANVDEVTRARLALATLPANAAPNARRAVIANTIAAVPNVDADKDAITALVAAMPYPAQAFVDRAAVNHVHTARIRLAHLAAGAPAADQRNAMGVIANLPVAEADIDAIVAAVAARPFPAREFVNMANRREVILARADVVEATTPADKRAAVENEMSSVPISDADIDAIVAILEASR